MKIGGKEIDLNDPSVDLIQVVVNDNYLTVLEAANDLGVCGLKVVALNEIPEGVMMFAVVLEEGQWVKMVKEFRETHLKA